MEKEQFLGNIKNLKLEKTKFVNETYYWVDIARQSIMSVTSKSELVFTVPKAKDSQAMRTVKRRNGQAVTSRIINQDIYFSAFTSLIASVEDYLNKVMRNVLLYDEKRVKFILPDTKMKKEIPLVDFIDKDRCEIIDEIIDDKMNSLFYASPKKQLDFLDKGIGVKIDESTWNSWVEMKARRDLIVHNNATVNDIYLSKVNSSTLSRGAKIVIDEKYFNDTNRVLKHLIGSVCSLISNNYK